MKKKIVMGLFVLATVIGMGFAGTKYYSCGHPDPTKIKGSNKKVTTLCSACQKKEDLDSFKKIQDKYCTIPDDQLSVQDYKNFNCADYNKSNN